MSHPCEEQAGGTASASGPPAWPELGLPGSQMAARKSASRGGCWFLGARAAQVPGCL